MFSQLSGLELLDLSSNDLAIRNASALFAPLKNLQSFNIGDNHLNNIPEILQALPLNIMTLDLSFNYVGELSLTTFQRFTNLQFLNLSHTNLSNFGFNTFYHQTNLQKLDLSYNNLKQIDFHLFVQNFRFLNETQSLEPFFQCYPYWPYQKINYPVIV